MTLHGCCSLSSVAHSRSASSASVRLRSLLSKGSVPVFPRTWAKHVRTRSAWRLQVVDVRPFSPPTCGFMTSARIASSCVTRPRFELGHSSRAPQVSAKRVRLSCSLKSRFFSCMHHDVLNVGLFTPHMSSSPFAPVAIMPDVFDDSTAASEPGLNKASLSGSRLTFEWSHCSKIRYHGIQWQPQTSPALWCKAPLAPLGEHLSFN